MAKWFGSFLVRYWRLSGGDERIEIEHIQTGERVLVASLPAALDWIAGRHDSPAAEGADPTRVVASSDDPGGGREPGA